MLELKSIEDLKACPRNPRRITGEALAGLKVSLAAFGDIGGLVWNAKWREEQEAKLLEPFEEHGCRITNSWSSITRTRDWYIRHIETGLGQTYLQPDTQSVQDARENVIAAASILSGRLEREKQEKEAERMSDETSPELRRALDGKLAATVANLAGLLVVETKCTLEQARAFLREKGIEVTP